MNSAPKRKIQTLKNISDSYFGTDTQNIICIPYWSRMGSPVAVIQIKTKIFHFQ